MYLYDDLLLQVNPHTTLENVHTKKRMITHPHIREQK